MQRQAETIGKRWDYCADGYDAIVQNEFAEELAEKWSEILKNHAPCEKGKVLDIGTGPGFFAVLMGRMGWQVTGIDCSEKMVETAARNAGKAGVHAEFYQMDNHQLDFPEDTFDYIICRNVTWILYDPLRALEEWKRVLKPGGQLLNFDANWYGHLFDAEKRREYEEDRKHVEEQAMEDHYIGTDIDEMEEIARNVPLSPVIRPAWDMKVLKNLGFQSVHTDEQVWQRVWSDTEKVNYASTPMFMIKAVK